MTMSKTLRGWDQSVETTEEAPRRFLVCMETRNIAEVTDNTQTCVLCGQSMSESRRHGVFRRRRDAEMALMRRD
ncbi:MAG: hypothetical protein ACE5PO_04915 [Candidatus Bathyarchaeia archaeon]